MMRFAGYAAIFGVPDGARDIIHAGAFARTLAERRDPLPLYWQHSPRQRIGWIETAREDARGLRVVAQIDNRDSRAATLLRARDVSGLSFGFRARRSSVTDAGRALTDIELFEISVVTHPLQAGARVQFLSET